MTLPEDKSPSEEGLTYDIHAKPIAGYRSRVDMSFIDIQQKHHSLFFSFTLAASKAIEIIEG